MVEMVDLFEDLRIKVDYEYPELVVTLADGYADECIIVDSYADFKVKFVDYYPDL